VRRVPRAVLPALVTASLHLSALHAATIQAIDDRGERIALAHPAQRVVTLAPHLTELVYAAGAGASLIGADSASDYPAAAAGIARVGDAAGLDLERIVALRPALVLGWLSGNKASDISRLEQLGFTVFLSEPRRLSDIPRTLRLIGLLLGTASVAEHSASAFERGMQGLQLRAGQVRPVSVFVEVWHEPLITVSAQHIISDVLALCGGYNVLAALPELAPTVSLESVLVQDPEVIIGGGAPPGALAAWDRFPRVRAVQRRQLYAVDPDLITRATPRILEGAQQVCQHLETARGSR
jgi:iron complex transport system substrate-binding protein